MSKLIAALVLCDVANHGLKVGQIVEADAALIKVLAAGGSVDPHRDAIAYAKSQGAAVVRSSVELEAERIEEQKAALRVEIAELEALAEKQEDPATKAAIVDKTDAKRAELAAIS